MNEDRNINSHAVTQARAARPTRRIAAVLGFLLKAEADAIFRQQPFETMDGADHLQLWREYEQNRQHLPPLTTGELSALPSSLNPLVEQVKARKTYREHYEAVADYSFMAAPVGCLLSPQWYADLDFIDEIASQLATEMSADQQLLFAMSEGRVTEPIVTGNQVYFTSPRRDLYAQPVPVVREVSAGEFEIVIRAASRPNYIQVAAIGERLLLVNGVHKVCALMKMGYENCMCVVRSAHNLAEVGLNPQQSSLFREPVFQSQRPALVADFLNPLTAAPLRMRAMFQVLQVATTVGTITVPAMPKSPERPSTGSGGDSLPP